MALVVLGFRLIDRVVTAFEGVRIGNATHVRSVGYGYSDETCHGTHYQTNGCG